MKIFLEGDQLKASEWIAWAMHRLRLLKVQTKRANRQARSMTYKITDDITIALEKVLNGYDIRITAQPGGFIIICYVGEDTGDFSSKRFYDDTGREIARDEVGYTGTLPTTPPGWVLQDDGMYGPDAAGLDPVDPWNNTYAWVPPGGLGVPSNGSGIASKKQAGKVGRYILNGAIEDETFIAIDWRVVYEAVDYTYHFVKAVDSLTYAPYSIYGPRPYFTKYLGDKVITMIVPWSGYSSTLNWDPYAGEGFLDVIPKVQKIWQVNADGTRTGTDVVDYADTNDAVISAAGYKDEDNLNVRVLRAKTNTWLGSLMAEPVRAEVYDVTAGTRTDGEAFHRCADPANENCFFWDSDVSSGTSTISDDAIIPYSTDSSGKMTYVRVQKSGDFESMRTSLYCAGTLVTDSGWESVTKTEDAVYGPLLIRNTRHRIIQAYSEQGFNVVLYSKTTYDSHTESLIPYKIYVSSVGDYCQVKKTMIRSLTTYHVAVNGVITDLGYSNYRREYRLTVPRVAYAGPSIPAVYAHIVSAPWVDAGYDDLGNMLSEDNQCVMRCYPDVANGRLLLDFDVFPVAYRHDLVYDAHDNLTLEFDESVMTYPPSSDAQYANVTDRKWWIFGSNGILVKEITPPQLSSGGHVNRINGLAFMGA